MSNKGNYGYRQAMTYRVNNSEVENIGIRLAKLCVSKNIPVTDVAEYFGVSRQAVYMWFRGKCKPNKALTEKVEKLVEKLSKQ